MTEFILAVVAGVAIGMPILLLATGLGLVYGALDILNFAQGGFYMVGAFLLSSMLGSSQVSVSHFVGASLVAALLVGAGAALLDRTVFGRVTHGHDTAGLLISFALLEVLIAGAEVVWGSNPRAVIAPKGLEGSISILGSRVLSYHLALIVVGALVALALHLLVRRTAFGRDVRAVASDAAMATACGVWPVRVRVIAFFLGGALGGLAGSLNAPISAITPAMGHDLVIAAFAAVLIGGATSVVGWSVGAIGIGVTQSLLVSYLPSLSTYAIDVTFALVIMTLLYRSSVTHWVAVQMQGHRDRRGVPQRAAT